MVPCFVYTLIGIEAGVPRRQYQTQKTMYSFTVLLSTIQSTFYNTIFTINIKITETAMHSNIGIGHTLTHHTAL